MAVHLWIIASPATQKMLHILSFWGTSRSRAGIATIEFELEPPTEPDTPTEPEVKKSPTFIDQPEDTREAAEAPKNADLIGMKNTVARDDAVETPEADNEPHMTGEDRDMVSNLGTREPGPEAKDPAPAAEEPGSPAHVAAVPPPAVPIPEVMPVPQPDPPPQPEELRPEHGEEPVLLPMPEPTVPQKRRKKHALEDIAFTDAQPPLMQTMVRSQGSTRRRSVVLDAPRSSARHKGELAFNIKADEYAPYYKHILDRIGLAWYIHSGWDFSAALKPGEEHKISVTFRVARSGEIRDAKIADDGGSLLLATRILNAVKSASPLNAFDDYIKEERLAIRFTFLF